MERRTGGIVAGAKTVGRLFSVAFRQAQQSEIDVLARRRFLELHEARGPKTSVSAPEPEGETADAEERTPHEETRGHSFPGPGQPEGSFPGSF